MAFDPSHFLAVRPHLREIDNVWPREQIARLKEVNVRVDVTGQNEFAFAIHDARMRRQNLRTNRGDTITVDYEGAVHIRLDNLNLSAGADQRAAGERDFFAMRSEHEDRPCKSECDFQFHWKEIHARLCSVQAIGSISVLRARLSVRNTRCISASCREEQASGLCSPERHFFPSTRAAASR